MYVCACMYLDMYMPCGVRVCVCVHAYPMWGVYMCVSAYVYDKWGVCMWVSVYAHDMWHVCVSVYVYAMWGVCLCMYMTCGVLCVHISCVSSFLQRSDDRMGARAAGDLWAPQCRLREQNSGSLKEQQVLSIPEPPLQHLHKGVIFCLLQTFNMNFTSKK